MNKQSRLQNISDMEDIFNNLELSLKDMKKSVSKWNKSLPKFKKLMDYYESEQWKKDYDDVNTWKLKPQWPHWILSEDAIYDFYQEQKELTIEIIKLAAKYLKI